MKTWVFEIPGRLPGLNEMIAAINRDRYAGAELKKKTTKLCGQWIIFARVPRIVEPVTIHCEWIEPNARRDLDNVSAGIKFVLDALVQTGRLKNDTRACVRGITNDFPRPDKKNPKVRVSIREAIGEAA